MEGTCKGDRVTFKEIIRKEESEKRGEIKGRGESGREARKECVKRLSKGKPYAVKGLAGILFFFLLGGARLLILLLSFLSLVCSHSESSPTSNSNCFSFLFSRFH